MERYNLKWESYPDHLKDMMLKMMTTSEFSDVTLICNDRKQIKSHKNILSACSPLFKEMLQIDKGASSLIYLKGINSSEMELIIQFVYLGEASFPQENMNEFFDVAKSLEIKELCNYAGNQSDDFSKTDKENEFEKSFNKILSQEPNNFAERFQQILDQEQTKIVENFQQKSNRNQVSNKVGNSNHKCDKCEKVYSDSANLSRHKKTHAGIKYSCDKCGAQFNDNSNLKKHAQTIHDGVKFVCSECGQHFSQKANLMKHMTVIHDM